MKPLGSRDFDGWKILDPWHPHEAMTTAAAAKLAGCMPRTMRDWIQRYGSGRKVGGHWRVSRIALAMYLSGDADALAAYHGGVRHDLPVVEYYAIADMLGVLNSPAFAALEENRQNGKCGKIGAVNPDSIAV